MRILLAAVVFISTLFTAQAQTPDIIDDVFALLKTSDTKEISKHFASTVELTILTEEDVYSKVQAELILKNFLDKHQPEAVKIIHRLNSNPNYRFGVALLSTSNGSFRTSFSMKNTAGRFQITEMRIEQDKE